VESFEEKRWDFGEKISNFSPIVSNQFEEGEQARDRRTDREELPVGQCVSLVLERNGGYDTEDPGIMKTNQNVNDHEYVIFCDNVPKSLWSA